MVKVSASRPITTPLNLSLEPFGTDCRRRLSVLRTLLGCTFDVWPKTDGIPANNSVIPTTRVNARQFFVTLVVILVSYLGRAWKEWDLLNACQCRGKIYPDWGRKKPNKS